MVGLDLYGIVLDVQIEILNDRIQQLEVAIKGLHSRIVPPNNFNGSEGSSIEYFFFLFERHCLSVYGEDQLSWLQVLPSFLEGKLRDMVVAFGLGRDINYNLVEERLIWELEDTSLQDRYYEAFCTASKGLSESESCYSICLEVLIGRCTYLTSDVERFLVISKFLTSL